MPTVTEKRSTFRRLHESGCFVIPNPWDVGSTRYLQHLGFSALATTSAGAAFALGYADNAVPFETMLAHIAELTAASDVPMNADFGSGYARDVDGVAANVARCVATGVAGLSIEDRTDDGSEPLFPFDHAVARVRAARTAIDRTGGDVLLTGRCEGVVAGRPDLAEVIRRLTAYAEAGADCLFAPGIATREQIDAVVRAVAPKPVNVLVGAAMGLSLADLDALGVRRISVGSGLARAAWGAFMRAARTISEHGRFDGLADAASGGELNRLFSEDRARRR